MPVQRCFSTARGCWPVLMFFLALSLCRAEELDHLFSLDLSYSITGFRNHGWGLGLNYEKKIFDYLSVKTTFGHMTFLTGVEHVYCASVNMSLFANYYPFGKGLEALYIALGSDCDFMNYFGKGEVPPDAQDILIFMTPKIGWKYNIKNYVMVDLSAAYKFAFVDASNYREIERYTKTGLQLKLGFKIFFENLQNIHKKKEN
jgi:hypothetical protein